MGLIAWIKKLRHPKRSPQFRSAFISHAQAMEDHRQELAQLKRLQSSAPSSKPEPMAYWVGEIAVTPPKPQPSGGRLFINGIEQPQPTGSETLLEMVGYAIDEEPWEDEVEGAVLAVARWLRSQGAYTAVHLLEREIGK